MRIIIRLIAVAMLAALGAVVSAVPALADPGIGASPGGPSGLAPGTMYEPAPGAPAFGPLPPPVPVFLPGAIGLPPGAVVDSISYGDATVQLGVSPFHVLFSVAPGSTGHPASVTVGPHGSVFNDAFGGDGSVDSDVFSSFSITAPATPFGAFAPFFPPSPCGPIESNNQTADENGLPPFPFAAPNVGLGLMPGDNLDKLEARDNTAVDFIPPTGNGIPDAPIFFSLDAATAAGLPPLPPFFGPNSAADVYAWDPATSALYDWMPFFVLGLAPGDDIDALEVGHISGAPILAGYTGFPDIVFFSLTPASPSLGGLATGCFPAGFATGGDIFAAAGGLPAGAVDAEMLGLNTLRSGGIADDDLDALDFVLAASADLDADGIDDAADFDDDGDLVGDMIDNCPLVANPTQANAVHPATSIGDACEDPEPDGVMDAVDNCPDVANPSQANNDAAPAFPWIKDDNGAEGATTGGDACEPNDDNDGCADTAEAGLDHALGGDRDPLNPWDFADVPAPALVPTDMTGTRDKKISLSRDVLSVLKYVGTLASSPNQANGNGAMYGSDLNANGILDGVEYDRTASTNPAKPWQTRAPNGIISLSGDVLTVLKSVGDLCQ